MYFGIFIFSSFKKIYFIPYKIYLFYFPSLKNLNIFFHYSKHIIYRLKIYLKYFKYKKIKQLHFTRIKMKKIIKTKMKKH